MGNICRSPTAHGVFLKYIKEQSLHNLIGVDSAGTYAYNIGAQPDPRARAAAANRGYDLSKLKARKVNAYDFLQFDYVLAMDNTNKQDLLVLCEEEQQNKIRLFLEFTKEFEIKEVPDPYHGGLNGFETVLDLIEEACQGLLGHIKEKHLLKML